jgi:hypothetical protein
MKNTTLYLFSLILSVGASILGAFLKVLHLPGASFVLGAGLALSLVYIFIGLHNVFTNRRIVLAEKIMWLVGFLFLNWIAGIVYYVRCKSVKTNQ